MIGSKKRWSDADRIGTGVLIALRHGDGIAPGWDHQVTHRADPVLPRLAAHGRDKRDLLVVGHHIAFAGNAVDKNVINSALSLPFDNMGDRVVIDRPTRRVTDGQLGCSP